jgi:TonB family protein
MPIVLAYAEPPAVVAPSPAAAGPITDPQWESVRARPGEMERYYPPRALAEAASGVAIIECRVSGKGSLEDCKVLREEPEGMQFGDAAVKLASRFQMKTTTRSGATAVGRVVRMPIEFNFSWSMFEPISARPSFDVLASPKWTKRPSQEDLARFYPDTAARMALQGDVTLHCQIQVDGHLSECSVDKEQPDKHQFGEAALKLSSFLQIDIRQGPGLKAAGKWIDIPVHFGLPR